VGEELMALPDVSVTTEFLCLRVLLARAGAAPEDTTGSELVLLLVAIRGYFTPKVLSLTLSILPNFRAHTVKSFYEFHHGFGGRAVSDKQYLHACNEVY
jgi:hypothetical protein